MYSYEQFLASFNDSIYEAFHRYNFDNNIILFDECDFVVEATHHKLFIFHQVYEYYLVWIQFLNFDLSFLNIFSRL